MTSSSSTPRCTRTTRATEVAPAVRAAGLDYEPVIFVTDAEGTVVERIDIIWDDADLSAMLDRAVA
jgi:hypothetical protein